MLANLFIFALAALRLYYLLAYDNGPGNILARFRLWVGVLPYDKSPGYITKNSFAFGLMCPSCSTLWYGLILVAGYKFFPIYTWPIVWVLALSMLAVLIMNIQTRILR